MTSFDRSFTILSIRHLVRNMVGQLQVTDTQIIYVAVLAKYIPEIPGLSDTPSLEDLPIDAIFRLAHLLRRDAGMTLLRFRM